MRIIIALFLMITTFFVAGAPALANTITLKIAQNGSITASLDIPRVPKGPNYVLAVLPFELSSRAIIEPEVDPKDFAFVVSSEPRGVLAITGYTGSARFSIRNAVDAIDGERLKIRLAKQAAPYEALRTLENPPGVLLDSFEKAIITWTTQIDLPENVEDLKPDTLKEVRSRLTLGKAEIGEELIIDMKNPAIGTSAISTRFGNVITVISALLVGVAASFGVWWKAPPWLYGVFVAFVAIATSFAAYRAFIHGWSEALSTLGGGAGTVTLSFNLLLIGVAFVRKRRIATVSGTITTEGEPVGGVSMRLENSAKKPIAHAASDRDGNYQMTFWAKGSVKQGYTLNTMADFAKSWHKNIELGPGDTETADVELLKHDVVGNWNLDQSLTRKAISQSLARCVGRALEPDEATRIADELKKELRYPDYIQVQKDNLVQVGERRSGKWQAIKGRPGVFEVSITGAPGLQLMECSGNELVLRGRKPGLLAAVYAKKSVTS